MTKCKAPKNQSRPGDIKFTLPTRTKRAFKNDFDLNHVIERYHKTGILPQMRTDQPTYGDYSNPIDYQEAQNKIMLANDLFGALPARIRRDFDDDPGTFLAFASNPDNLEELVEMGLADPSSLQSRSTEPIGDPTAEPGENNASGVAPDDPTEA